LTEKQQKKLKESFVSSASPIHFFELNKFTG